MVDRLLHTRKEAAELLGISLRKLDELVTTKVLQSRRIGRRRLVPREALEHLARKGQC